MRSFVLQRLMQDVREKLLLLSLYHCSTAAAAAHPIRCMQALGVDIHPGARVGQGVFMDHACGVVIGETAVIGNNVTIMQVIESAAADVCSLLYNEG
jgi:serine acetyltransferase